MVTETIRGDKDLVTVVLGADTKKDRTKDSIELIEYGFRSFKEFNLEEEFNKFFNEWENINKNRITLIKGVEKNIELKTSELKTKNYYYKKKILANLYMK